jgi:hypothetical protein
LEWPYLSYQRVAYSFDLLLILIHFFRGRKLREITFTPSNSLRIGSFLAHDFFGDASFYLLDTPGHAVGHLGGLVRTTSSTHGSPGDTDTFVFLGGDLCHHAGELRPSPYLPLPQELTLPGLAARYAGGVCPGADLEALQVRRGRGREQPFFEPASGYSVEETNATIEKTWVADVRDDVLFIFAHDTKVGDVVDFFPKRANEWKEKGWREKVLWRFVEDFEEALKKRESEI